MNAVELEGQLAIRTKEVEDAKEGRAKDAQDLLANAKERLSVLHTEVCPALLVALMIAI
jgi:hypothetical protein